MPFLFCSKPIKGQDGFVIFKDTAFSFFYTSTFYQFFIKYHDCIVSLHIIPLIDLVYFFRKKIRAGYKQKRKSGIVIIPPMEISIKMKAKFSSHIDFIPDEDDPIYQNMGPYFVAK